MIYFSTMTRSKKLEKQDEISSFPKDSRLYSGDAEGSGETRAYLEGILGRYKDLAYRIALARSTPRQKVAEATISMFLARAQSLSQFLACGGEAAPMEIQAQIFGPVLEYWEGFYGRDAGGDSDE